MLKVLVGKNEIFLDTNNFEGIISEYKHICVDIGTGDGTFVYKKAVKTPDAFFIGIDPVRENMEETAYKISKKYKKKSCNILLVVSPIENIPLFVHNIAESITVYFPWGILLEAIVKPVEKILKKLVHIAKNNATFDFMTTYAENYEGNEIKNRDLPKINLEYFDERYNEKLKKIGLILENIYELSNEELKTFDSQWAKKLAFGRTRRFFRLNGIVKK